MTAIFSISKVIMIVRYAPKIIVLVIIGLIGWQMYAYFFDTTAARVIINGVAENCFNHNKSALAYDFYVDNLPLQAVFVKTGTPYKVFQGRTLHVQFQVNKE